MGIWVELGIFVLFIAFALWQMHDVRQAQEQTRRQRERERAQQGQDPEAPGQAGPQDGSV